MRYTLLLLLLSGCAMNDALIAKHIADTAPICMQMGYKADTDAFRDCQLRLYQSNVSAASAATMRK